MGNMRSTYRIIVAILAGKSALGSFGRRWDSNIKIYFERGRYRGTSLINPAGEMDQCPDAAKLRVP
jgi:hypothetical protein